MPDDTIPRRRTGQSIAPGGLGDWGTKTLDMGGDPNSMTASDGMTISIDADTGEVSFPAAPAIRRQRDSSGSFDDNLAEDLQNSKRGGIASETIEGIDSDIGTRQEFIMNYNKGIELLGLKIEDATSAQRGPRRSISKYRHPALLDACVSYQSLARSQLLPSDGPVKIVEVEASTGDEAVKAQQFQDAFNYYLTDIAKEYYPDTDRGLFYQAFGGTVYKKVYNCPVRRRPVSECVYLPSLIVSEDATDLETAVRVTHEIYVSKSKMKRMQLAGVWADVTLSEPQAITNQAVRKEKESQGINPSGRRPQDQPYTVYECYTDLDPEDFGIVEKDAPSGLPLPYRITIDKDSQQVLEIRRNWVQGDEEFKARQRFVKYGLVPGLGFLDYGFLHLVGNQTRALTAIWQLMIDGGMLGNFPGGIKAKGARLVTNEIVPGLGEWIDVDFAMSGGSKLSDCFMAMPYKDTSVAFLQLAQAIEENARRMSGTIDIEVGEGRTNVPVGTVMAMIEQQTQTAGAIHKRNWTAQKQELMLMRELFLEDPAALTKLNPNPDVEYQLAEEFSDYTLSPFSDPNVPSQIHRIMQAQTLEQMAVTDPQGLNRQAIHIRSFRAMGISDPESLIAPPPPPGAGQPPPPPMDPASMLKAQAAMQKVQSDQGIKQQQAELEVQKLDQQGQEQQRQAATTLQESQERDKDRQTEATLEQQKIQLQREQVQSQERQHIRETAHDAHQQGLDRLMDHVHHTDGQQQADADRHAQAQQPAPQQPVKAPS